MAPPYDVIDPPLREELAARSPFNVVEIDLPEADGRDPYQHAEETLRELAPAGRAGPGARAGDLGAGAVLHHARRRAARPPRGLRARARGGLRPRPHPAPRAHPSRAQGGPAAPDPRHAGQPLPRLQPVHRSRRRHPGASSRAWPAASPWPRARDDEGTDNTLWRIADPTAITALSDALGDAELLIADGHHRYETARVYAEEVGGEGPHRYVLMLLCSLADPGLAVFPTHRLLTGLKDDTAKQQAIREVLTTHFEVEQVDDPAPPATGPRLLRLHGLLPPPALPRHPQGSATRWRARSPTSRRPTATSTPRCSRRSCSRARWG